MEQFSLRLDQLERAPKSKRILRKILSKTDCLTCGSCCRSPQGRHKTNILGIDPFRRNLRQIARERGFDISEALYEGFVILGKDRCAFLGVEGKKNACSVYNIRPLICLLFPFIMQRMESLDLANGEKGTVSIIMLTTACPPLKEAKAQGVNYVGIDEIISSQIIDGRKALVSEMPILGDTFLNILRTRMDAGLFDLNKVLDINGRGVLPIG